MGQFQSIYDLLKTPVNDACTFLIAIAVIGAGAMGMYYKIREMFGNPQEDQMFSQKTTKVFTALIYIFLIPTIIKIIQGYLEISG
ncbi:MULTISPECIES: hypothetical protein [unclassified Breznakia]|uniref:hypothetical protein n=1 Tax=unclassified Breznakia TaxID=2623764 RepID=UPI0024747C76|nr:MULTISPECIES: hypothetical protein [unclassified Breznakia]MDH6367390.1 hypothetical protein [Breznakia sp. PH1-1]MDH6403922.1 hypothetical protein [Breznakia sp. PF1-11]MDH6411631.1 hypothetical protein [Breznakia sp. PFB1-11]MDH6414557.1 hypothetical protein [Breznakia sp. PFB1-14]MDH6418663.1 hypothetical protein [Breznakia sp. PFB1-12]